MVVGALSVTESTPRHGDEVALVGNIEVTVHTIREVAMVYPQMRCIGGRDKVAAAEVARTGADKLDIAYYYIITVLYSEDTRLTIGFRRIAREVYQGLTGAQLAFLSDCHAVAQSAARTR